MTLDFTLLSQAQPQGGAPVLLKGKLYCANGTICDYYMVAEVGPTGALHFGPDGGPVADGIPMWDGGCPGGTGTAMCTFKPQAWAALPALQEYDE
jgi:hypothetical protein